MVSYCGRADHTDGRCLQMDYEDQKMKHFCLQKGAPVRWKEMSKMPSVLNAAEVFAWPHVWVMSGVSPRANTRVRPGLNAELLSWHTDTGAGWYHIINHELEFVFIYIQNSNKKNCDTPLCYRSSLLHPWEILQSFQRSQKLSFSLQKSEPSTTFYCTKNTWNSIWKKEMIAFVKWEFEWISFSQFTSEH